MVKVLHVQASEDSTDTPYGKVILEWNSGPLADCVADSIVSVLLQEQGPPAAIGAAEQERKYAVVSSQFHKSLV
jgi:hypothetical protein